MFQFLLNSWQDSFHRERVRLLLGGLEEHHAIPLCSGVYVSRRPTIFIHSFIHSFNANEQDEHARCVQWVNILRQME